MMRLFKILNRFSTRHRFNDGSMLRTLHRYALRYEINGRKLDIGFEQALEPQIDRLIHLNTISHWNPPDDQCMLTDDEKRDVLKKISEYCKGKALTYKLV